MARRELYRPAKKENASFLTRNPDNKYIKCEHKAGKLMRDRNYETTAGLKRARKRQSRV